MVGQDFFPIFLFIGDEEYLKGEAIDDLRKSFSGGPLQDLDYKVFYGGETEMREILDYAATLPFSAAKRLVVIKDIENLSQEDRTRLSAYIKKPSKSTCLLLETKDDSAREEYSPVRRYIRIRRFGLLTGSALESWIKRYLASRGKRIEDAALEMLKEYESLGLASLTQEMEKLIAYLGEREDMRADDVERLIGKSMVASSFDLAWTINQEKVDLALGLVSDLILAGKKTYEIIGLLSWHFKRLLKAKALEARGESDYSIANILRIPQNRFNEFFKEMRSLSLAQIRSKMDILLETDLDVKRARFDPVWLLEFAIIRLCLGA